MKMKTISNIFNPVHTLLEVMIVPLKYSLMQLTMSMSFMCL